MKYNQFQIDIVIIPEGKEKSRVYSINSIQFPNIVTQGKTVEEAKRRLKEALELYFEEAPHEKLKLMKFAHQENTPIISRMLI